MTPSEGTSDRLTQREQEVLGLLIQRKSIKDTADALYVSIMTVKFHIINIKEKLGVTSLEKAFERAYELKLFDTR